LELELAKARSASPFSELLLTERARLAAVCDQRDAYYASAKAATTRSESAERELTAIPEQVQAGRVAYLQGLPLPDDAPLAYEVAYKREAAESRAARVEEALRWYADPNNWQQIGLDYSLSTNTLRTAAPPAVWDGGGRAHQALAAVEDRVASDFDKMRRAGLEKSK
jgi:hypothetical protein